MSGVPPINVEFFTSNGRQIVPLRPVSAIDVSSKTSICQDFLAATLKGLLNKGYTTDQIKKVCDELPNEASKPVEEVAMTPTTRRVWDRLLGLFGLDPDSKAAKAAKKAAEEDALAQRLHNVLFGLDPDSDPSKDDPFRRRIYNQLFELAPNSRAYMPQKRDEMPSLAAKYYPCI